MNNKEYTDYVKGINDEIYTHVKKIDSDIEENTIKVEDLSKVNFTSIYNNSFNFENSYQSPISMSKSNTNAFLGETYEVSIGNHNNIRDAVSLLNDNTSTTPSTKHFKYSSINKSSFIIGNKDSTYQYESSSTIKKYGSYSISEGKKYKSVLKYDNVTVERDLSSTYGEYYSYGHTSKMNYVTLQSFSANLGLVNYKTRGTRSINYLAMYNMNNYLASSRIFNLFLTLIHVKTTGTNNTRSIFRRTSAMQLFWRNIYSAKTTLSRKKRVNFGIVEHKVSLKKFEKKIVFSNITKRGDKTTIA